MSKIGIVEVAGLKKTIQLIGINVVQFNFNSIGISYIANVTNFQWSSSYVFIQFKNPGNEVSQAFIKQQFYKWLSDGLTASSPSVLNKYLPQVTITDVGIRGTVATGNIIAAVDIDAACLANPNTLVRLDYSGNTVPPVGTYIYDPNKNGTGLPGPIDAGNYALSYGSDQFFITVNSSSLISYIEICPLLLDFVYNLQNLGTGPVSIGNTDSISFSIDGSQPFTNTTYSTYYGTGSLPTNPPYPPVCDTSDPWMIYGSSNGMWPVGILNNGTANVPNFSTLDVAFGLKLTDPNVANFDNSQLYISFDYNTVGPANASFQPFALPFGQNPMFPASPGGGIPGFGDGTTSFSGGQPDFFQWIFEDYVYLPPGQSLIGTANFTDGAYCSWQLETGQITNVQDNTCPV